MWLAVDPLGDKYPAWSPYAYCKNSPIVRYDPDGADDIFNSEGKLVQRTNTGTRIYVITTEGKMLLSQVNTFQGKNAKTVARITLHYAKQVGIKGILGVDRYADKSVTLAYTAGPDKIFLAAGGGTVSNKLDDYNNLKSTLMHEGYHQEEFRMGAVSTFSGHFGVYLKQMTHETFAETTADFKSSTVAGAVNRLLNAYHQGDQGKYEKDFFQQDVDALNYASSQHGITVDIAEDKKSFIINQTVNGKVVQYKGFYKELENPSD